MSAMEEFLAVVLAPMEKGRKAGEMTAGHAALHAHLEEQFKAATHPEAKKALGAALEHSRALVAPKPKRATKPKAASTDPTTPGEFDGIAAHAGRLTAALGNDAAFLPLHAELGKTRHRVYVQHVARAFGVHPGKSKKEALANILQRHGALSSFQATRKQQEGRTAG